jgi:hypothetical protein
MSDPCDYCGYDPDEGEDDLDGLGDSSSFVGKFFLLFQNYWDDAGMWQEGYAGVVKAPVGSDSYLIQACKARFKQHIVSTAFFIESRALIFDTFDELKEAKEKRYPRKTAESVSL